MASIYRLFARPDGWHVAPVDTVGEEIVFPDRAAALAWIGRQGPAAVEDPDRDRDPRDLAWSPEPEPPRGGDHVIRSAD